MIIVLLILHGLLAVVLLGALTHQAFSVASVARGGAPRSFLDRFQRVNGAAYTKPIVVLFGLTAIGGALLYPQYRIDVRPTLEDLQLQAANGVFEIKEHLVAIGLGLLPGYWWISLQPLTAEHASSRRYLTWLLSIIVWWSFLVGHVLNNIKGLLP